MFSEDSISLNAGFETTAHGAKPMFAIFHNASSANHRASKISGGKKREQNRARGRNDRDHIDQVSRGHQQRRRGIGGRLVGLCLLALGPLWRCLRAYRIPREDSGSGALGGLTLTLSPSRFAPDLKAT
jgi:hypothetical protein